MKDRTRFAILGTVSAQIAFVMELTLVPVLLPSIQEELRLSLFEIALIFNAYSIAMAVGILACATVEGRFKLSNVFCLGVMFFFTGSILIYAATDNSAIIFGRVCQGLGAGIFSPLIPVLLTRTIPERPGRTLILWGSTAGYIAAFAPLAYGTLLTETKWDLAFLFIALVAGLSLVLIATSKTNDTSGYPNRIVGNYSDLFMSKALLLAFAYVAATYGAITFYLFRVPIALSELDISTVKVSIVLSVFWLSFSALSTLLRNMVDKHYLHSIMVSAPILITLGYLLALNTNLVMLIFSSCLVGCGLACSNAPSTQMILRFAPDGLSTFATCIDISVARLGSIAVVTVLAELSLGVSVVAIIVICLLAAVCAHTVAGKNLQPR